MLFLALTFSCLALVNSLFHSFQMDGTAGCEKVASFTGCGRDITVGAKVGVVTKAGKIRSIVANFKAENNGGMRLDDVEITEKGCSAGNCTRKMDNISDVDDFCDFAKSFGKPDSYRLIFETNGTMDKLSNAIKSCIEEAEGDIPIFYIGISWKMEPSFTKPNANLIALKKAAKPEPPEKASGLAKAFKAIFGFTVFALIALAVLALTWRHALRPGGRTTSESESDVGV